MRNGKIYFSVIKRNRTQKFCFAASIQRKYVDSAVFVIFVNLVLSAIENDTRYISYRKLKISISVVGNVKVSESFRGSSACIVISARKYYGLLPFRKISQKIYNLIIIFVGLNFSYIAVYYIEVCLIIIVCGAFERLLKTLVYIGEKISICSFAFYRAEFEILIFIFTEFGKISLFLYLFVIDNGIFSGSIKNALREF